MSTIQRLAIYETKTTHSKEMYSRWFSDNLTITPFYFLSKGGGEGREEKGLTQTFSLAYVEHPDCGRWADWIIYNAPRRHTTGNKNLRLAASRITLTRSCCFAFFLPFFPTDFRAKERLLTVYEFLSRDKI